ncbi:MFS transporter [Kineosporia rhizophila]|uniref:MFS transporter n=1 Tax=Kineosporia rhizophila TaxID=84633 RepID=UPI001E531043|nr:MFS transporter [Kineosporia rhizophila]MCE0538142.1 MFS transporter [Kineosporia rhizophila]
MNPTAESTRSTWLPAIGRRTWLLLGINMLSCLGSGLTMPFLIVYLHTVRGIGLPQAGLVLAAIGVVGLATTPLTGPLIDRFGPLAVFVAGLVVGGLGIGLFALATALPMAYAASAVHGVGSGLMWSGFVTFLVQLAPAGERGSVLALRYTSANVAFGLGALITGFVTVGQEAGPYVAILLADAASYLLFALTMLFLAGRLGNEPATPVAEAKGRVGYGPVLRDRALLGALLLNSLLMVFAISQTNSGFSAWVTGPGEGSGRVVGLAFALNIAVLLLAQLPAIRFARGRSRLQVAAVAALFFAGSWLVLASPALLDLDGPARDALMVASLGVFALGEATLSPTLPALINDLAPERLRGRYNAIFTLFNQIGPVLAPSLAGFALGAGLGVGYLIGLTAVCVVVGGISVLLRRVTPAHADSPAASRG